MDELSKIAKAYYQASSAHQKQLAQDFFDAMDDDRDGKIDRKEFMEFMNDQGHDQMTRLSFFEQLDLDANGTLDFVEVMRLYYIVKSGRPFCDNCKMFIPTTYFKCMCVGCLEDVGGRSIHLCLDCYTKQKCDHSNNDVSRFLDNYSLLEVMLKSNLSKEKSIPSETVTGLDSLTLENNTWNPFSSMIQVSNSTPFTLNHHSWSQCPPIAPLQYPPSRNNYTENLRLPMVQASNWRPPVNHHLRSQCPPTVPLRYPSSRNNYTWNQHVPVVQVLNTHPPIVNHDSSNQYQPTAPLQVLHRPPSIVDHHSWSQSVPTTSFQNMAPRVHQQTWIQHNYYQPPVVASNAIVPERGIDQEKMRNNYIYNTKKLDKSSSKELGLD
ncbi:hypothetical protein L6452_11611 [Arctium lappa]|uniref:Uncharacterized protein n=1 Tax=Arctium lappa TaxID=4217 RepID=A0ACB9DPL4_ARCLA|nr:hypothetical protein L6452_11611 [Arctium lappa]